jgi:hypothetical protein
MRQQTVSGSLAEARMAGTPANYRALIAGFVVFFALTLLALLDVRRALLFDVLVSMRRSSRSSANAL